MSKVLAQECQKRAAECAEMAELQDDPEHRRECLELATIWRVIAKETYDTEVVGNSGQAIGVISPTVSLCVVQLGGRAMPTRRLCPKCHGQRTISCPACSGLGGRCFAGVVVGICGQCHGSGQCRCDVCGGAAEVEPDALRRFEQPSAWWDCAASAARLVRRTMSELPLQRCDLDQIEPERRPNW